MPTTKYPPNAERKRLQQNRLQLLKLIVKKRFGGNLAEFSREIDRKHAYTWQIYNGRPMGDNICKHIEEKLRLTPGCLVQATGTRNADEQLDVAFKFSAQQGGEAYTWHVAPFFDWQSAASLASIAANLTLLQWIKQAVKAAKAHRPCPAPSGYQTIVLEA